MIRFASAAALLAGLAACGEPETPAVNEGNIADATVARAGEEQGTIGRGLADAERQEDRRSE